MFFIIVHSANDFGDWFVESWMFGSMGMESGFKSVKLYLGNDAIDVSILGKRDGA